LTREATSESDEPRIGSEEERSIRAVSNRRPARSARSPGTCTRTEDPSGIRSLGQVAPSSSSPVERVRHRDQQERDRGFVPHSSPQRGTCPPKSREGLECREVDAPVPSPGGHTDSPRPHPIRARNSPPRTSPFSALAPSVCLAPVPVGGSAYPRSDCASHRNAAAGRGHDRPLAQEEP